MFAASPAEAVPRTRQNIFTTKSMGTILFTWTRLLVMNSLPKRTKFNQDYFVDAVLPDLYSENAQIVRRKVLPSSSVHIDNSMCHKGAKITTNRSREPLAHLIHQTSIRATFDDLGS
jgi:hypothetical protein